MLGCLAYQNPTAAALAALDQSEEPGTHTVVSQSATGLVVIVAVVLAVVLEVVLPRGLPCRCLRFLAGTADASMASDADAAFDAAAIISGMPIALGTAATSEAIAAAGTAAAAAAPAGRRPCGLHPGNTPTTTAAAAAAFAFVPPVPAAGVAGR